MSVLIENSSAPVLLIEKGRVVVANRSARSALGQHIVGQDVRVVFRQPAAIKLLDRGNSGTATGGSAMRLRSSSAWPRCFCNAMQQG